jgi:hypothetical protein
VWQHAAASEDGAFLGIDLIVCGLTALDGLHGERVPTATRNAFAGTQIGQPVPREDACDADDKILPRGRNSQPC